MRSTVCRMKLHTALMPEKMGPSAKLQSTTIVTLTRLLAIRMVANRRSGLSRRANTRSPLGVSSSSSHCVGVSEKKAISLPETNPETKRAKMARRSATIWSMPMADTESMGWLMKSNNKFATASVAGKGSVSKSVTISYTLMEVWSPPIIGANLVKNIWFPHFPCEKSREGGGVVY